MNRERTDVEHKEVQESAVSFKTDTEEVMEIWYGCFESQVKKRHAPFAFDVPNVLESAPDTLGAETLSTYDDAMDEARLAVNN